MGLADIARAKQIQKQLDRLQAVQESEERDRNAYKFATYQGKDPVDGTDIVEVDGVATSGFKLMSNAPLGIGDRVNLRPNQQGLQRVDAKNVAPVVHEIAEEIEKIIYFSAFTFVGLLDAKTNKLIKEIESVDAITSYLIYCPANKNIYAASPYNIYVIKASQKRIIKTISEPNIPPQSLLFCPSNNKIYFCSENTLKVVSSSTNEIINTVAIADGQLIAGAYCPFNDKIYYSYLSSINPSLEGVYVIDPSSDTIIDFIADIPYPGAITYCPSNERLYLSRGNSHNISVINPSTNTVIAEIANTPNAYKPEYCPLNDSIYASNNVIDPNTNTVIQRILTGSIYGIAYYPFNKKIYAASIDGNIIIINPSTNLATRTITVGGAPTMLAFQP
jgi:YVTN family beta-propeller protein